MSTPTHTATASIVEEIKILSPHVIEYVERLARGPINQHGFSTYHATPQERWHLEDIAVFIRDTALHLRQLFREAQDTLGPRERLSEIPELDEPHEQQKFLLDLSRMRKKFSGQYRSLRLVWRPEDILHLHHLVVYLVGVVTEFQDTDSEPVTPDDEPLTLESLDERVTLLEERANFKK